MRLSQELEGGDGERCRGGVGGEYESIMASGKLTLLAAASWTQYLDTLPYCNFSLRICRTNSLY